jgi:hypothetical protein
MTTTAEDDDQDVLFDGDENVDKPEGQEEKEQGQSGSEVEGKYKISPLTLTVFKRETENGNVFRNYNLQRTYPKDDEGESFGYTESLRPRDLRKASRLFELAADDIQGLRKDQAGGGK